MLPLNNYDFRLLNITTRWLITCIQAVSEMHWSLPFLQILTFHSTFLIGLTIQCILGDNILNYPCFIDTILTAVLNWLVPSELHYTQPPLWPRHLHRWVVLSYTFIVVSQNDYSNLIQKSATANQAFMWNQLSQLLSATFTWKGVSSFRSQ